MKLNGVRSFIAVMDHGGFNAAADALSLAQPALSRSVKQLEATLGVQLIERGPWGIKATPAGEKFLTSARRILAAVQEAEATVTGRWSETIRLGAAATAAGSFLAKRLSTWLTQHPNARLIMIEAGANQMPAKIEQRECDFGIVAGPVAAQFNHRFVTEVTVQALLPPGHPLNTSTAPDTPLPIQELHRHPVVLNSDDFLSTQLFRTACYLARAEPDVVYQCSVGQTLAALAESGLGVAIMGDSVDLRGFDLQRRPIAGPDGTLLAFALHIAWLRDREPSSTGASLIEALAV